MYLVVGGVVASHSVCDTPDFLQNGRFERLRGDEVGGEIGCPGSREDVVHPLDDTFGCVLGRHDGDKLRFADQSDLFHLPQDGSRRSFQPPPIPDCRRKVSALVTVDGPGPGLTYESEAKTRHPAA